MLKISGWALQVGVLDAERLQVGAGLDAGRLFFFFLPPSIDQCSGGGGSSDVAVKLLGCVRVQLSEKGGRRKPRNKKQRGC